MLVVPTVHVVRLELTRVAAPSAFGHARRGQNTSDREHQFSLVGCQRNEDVDPARLAIDRCFDRAENSESFASKLCTKLHKFKAKLEISAEKKTKFPYLNILSYQVIWLTPSQ
jgi:hypothetical protein